MAMEAHPGFGNVGPGISGLWNRSAERAARRSLRDLQRQLASGVVNLGNTVSGFQQHRHRWSPLTAAFNSGVYNIGQILWASSRRCRAVNGRRRWRCDRGPTQVNAGLRLGADRPPQTPSDSILRTFHDVRHLDAPGWPPRRLAALATPRHRDPLRSATRSGVRQFGDARVVHLGATLISPTSWLTSVKIPCDFIFEVW